MSNAYELDCVSLTMKSDAATTIPAYSWVRLTTTVETVEKVTTRGTVAMFGIAQASINPGKWGEIAISGICRLRMGSTGFTTVMPTTPFQIGSNASGLGVHLTTSVTLTYGAMAMNVYAASDVQAVQLALPARPTYRI